jgi:tryptophanyl-tRNA synthetase
MHCRYDATLVPVGDDQLQHLELCRDVARSFNSRFIPARASSEYLKLPSAVLSGSSSSLHRIMSLDNPTAKMSKSDVSPHASIFLDDSNDRCPIICFLMFSL